MNRVSPERSKAEQKVRAWSPGPWFPLWLFVPVLSAVACKSSRGSPARLSGLSPRTHTPGGLDYGSWMQKGQRRTGSVRHEPEEGSPAHGVAALSPDATSGRGRASGAPDPRSPDLLRGVRKGKRRMPPARSARSWALLQAFRSPLRDGALAASGGQRRDRSMLFLCPLDETQMWVKFVARSRGRGHGHGWEGGGLSLCQAVQSFTDAPRSHLLHSRVSPGGCLSPRTPALHGVWSSSALSAHAPHPTPK